MIDLRVIAGGLGAGALLWSAVFPAELASEPFQALQRPPAMSGSAATSPALAQLAASKRLGLFPSAEAMGPLPNAADLRLQGTIQTPRRSAALISVAGAKPQWIALDAPAAGLELLELHAASAVVRTANGDTVTLEMFKTNAAAEGPAPKEAAHAPG